MVQFIKEHKQLIIGMIILSLSSFVCGFNWGKEYKREEHMLIGYYYAIDTVGKIIEKRVNSYDNISDINIVTKHADTIRYIIYPGVIKKIHNKREKEQLLKKSR